VNDELAGVRARLALLEERVAAQEAELIELRQGAQVEAAQPAEPAVIDTDDEGAHLGRRNLLRAAAIAAAGAAASVASARPSAAQNGDPVIAGGTTNATAPTVLRAPHVPTETFVVTDDPNYLPQLPPLDFPSTLLSAYATTDGRNGVSAIGGTYGLIAGGGLASLLLQQNDTDPFQDDRLHREGEVLFRDGVLYACVQSGVPGSWRRIASPFGMSHFVPLTTPQRLYDSRVAGGRINAGNTRHIDLPLFTDDAPRATLINLTVTDTTGPGFLAAVPSDGPDVPTTSSINWFGPNQIIANTTVVRLGPDFDIKIYMGGSGSTHFVIDQIAWLE